MGGKDNSTIHRILTEVAETEGVDPLKLPQIGKTVDPDAFESLLDSSDDVHVESEYAGYEVESTNDGVSIDET